MDGAVVVFSSIVSFISIIDEASYWVRTGAKQFSFWPAFTKHNICTRTVPGHVYENKRVTGTTPFRHWIENESTSKISSTQQQQLYSLTYLLLVVFGSCTSSIPQQESTLENACTPCTGG